MATTLSEFTTRVRRQLGEPTAAFHTDAEIQADISVGQRQLCGDTVTHDGFSLITHTERHHVRQGQRVFTVPNTAIEVLSAEYLDGTTWVQLTQHTEEALEDYRGDTYTTTPLHFAVRQAREIITEGIATGGSATTIVDADRTAASNFSDGFDVKNSQGSQMSAGSTEEWVENVTDGSIARINAVTNDTTLTFVGDSSTLGIQGGKRLNFEAGDHYRVLADVANRLEVVLRNGAGTTSFSTPIENTFSGADSLREVGNDGGTNTKQAQSFLLSRAAGIVGVSIKLGASTGTPLGNLFCRLEEETTSLPNGTLIGGGANQAKGSIETPTASAWNTFWFLASAYRAANTATWAVVDIAAQSDYYASPSDNYFSWLEDTDSGYTNGSTAVNTGSWAAGSNDFQFKVHVADEGGPLRIRYAALPKEITGASDLLEIPLEAEKALMHRVLVESFGKRQGTQSEQQYHENMFEFEMDKIRKRVRMRSRSGYATVRDETANFLPYRIRRSRPSGAQRLSYEA
ncbi:MAG: hypothetical protein HN396_10835 [Gemmatimonadales bacterium]|jgi:hypothetical protein|nr:hypothetical protein [Gemmatimonadales bacterium]